MSNSNRPAARGTASTRGIRFNAARCLGLAAAPTFAVMALYTAISGRSLPDVICSASGATSPLHGMVLMYLLMSFFHLPPWLKLLGSWQRGRAHRSRPQPADPANTAPLFPLLPHAQGHAPPQLTAKR